MDASLTTVVLCMRVAAKRTFPLGVVEFGQDLVPERSVDRVLESHEFTFLPSFDDKSFVFLKSFLSRVKGSLS